MLIRNAAAVAKGLNVAVLPATRLKLPDTRQRANAWKRVHRGGGKDE